MGAVRLVRTHTHREDGMIDLYDTATQDFVGQISEAQLKFLIDQLVETDASDQDYYIDGATLELLETEGAAEDLVQLLRKTLGERDGMEVRWEEATTGDS